MKLSIQSVLQILLLSTLVISCSRGGDSGHVVIQPKEVIGNDSPTIKVGEAERLAEAEKKTEEERNAEEETQLENIKDARIELQLEIFSDADDEVITDLNAMEDVHYKTLLATVESREIKDVGKYTESVESAIDLYFDNVYGDWDVLDYITF